MIITIKLQNESITTDIRQGSSLLDAINKAGIEGFDAPCGGKGTCGKCRVKVDAPETAPEPDSLEQKMLTQAELEEGVRLACRVFPEADMRIEVSAAGKKAVIQSAFGGAISEQIIADSPVSTKRYVNLPQPTIDDQRSDYRRLADAIEEGEMNLPLHELRRLPSLLRENSYSVTVLDFFDHWIAVDGGDTTGSSWAVAVDIGTTTVVAYLLSLTGNERGSVADFVSGLNSQKGYGGDVISRIEYCMQKDGNLDELHWRITGQISAMVKELAVGRGISLNCINLVTIAGNTTMTHLFAGLDPTGIASAPFIPVATGLCASRAAYFGLDLPHSCGCVVLPGIASYVGADITAGIVATGMHETDELSILIDVGTNGEIVLGSRDGMTACSTAAGPALEGANISCGMGGIPGAINSLTAEECGDEEVFSFSVIGDEAPAGICGSGIVDALALFLNAGVVDNTGRILNDDELAEAGVHRSWINCVVREESKTAVRISGDIMLTQKDIREIQMAKAAVAAGVKTLLAETGKSIADVKKLYIAGGFGAAMNKANAAVIGLFPPELEPVVEIAGNTAGKGAVLAALSGRVVSDMEKIADSVDYIELSTSALFQQEYMMEMYFQQSLTAG